VEGKAVHTPGHTSGCVSVFLADGQAIVGDLLAGRRKGRRAMLPMFLWDGGELRRSLERVLKEAPTIIHNAHGDACPLDACRELVDSMRTTPP
jgi:hydroxyacylglutathione hydrolase